MAFEKLEKAVQNLGKESWKEVLNGHVQLLRDSMNLAIEGFLSNDWISLGTGYVCGPAFGHWDIMHSTMNLIFDDIDEAVRQLENDLENQYESGFLPGVFYKKADGNFRAREDQPHPPVWALVADAIYEFNKDKELLKKCVVCAEKQLGWFERERKVKTGGYYYAEILEETLKPVWECGVDQGVRFDKRTKEPSACIDATSYAYLLADFVARRSAELGEKNEKAQKLAEEIKTFTNEKLYDKETRWYYDECRMADKKIPESLEGFWPLVVGIADGEKAEGVVSHLMNPNEFFTEHPFAMVSPQSPKFEKRMWRGPAWNSMTAWGLWGLVRYGYKRQALEVIEKALDATAKVYKETGKIWEFYDSLGGSPYNVQRKPQNNGHINNPSRDYVGHATMIFMAHVWEDLKKQ